MRLRTSRTSTWVGSLALSAFLLGGSLSSSQVWAQIPDTAAAAEGQREPLSISPPTAELSGAPGQTLTQKFAITNGSSTPRTVNTDVKNFTAADESGNAAFSDEPTSYEMAGYSTITPASAVIPPSETVDFEVKIVLPENASPGGHYGAYFFEAAPPATAGAVTTKAQVTGLILLRVAGDVVENASIESFTTHTEDNLTKTGADRKATTFFQDGPVNFSVRIRNDGNVQVKPNIEVVVRNSIGREVTRLKPVAPGNVLPESIRDFRVNWDRDRLAGRYTAEAIVTYGTDKPTLTSTTSFWGVPILLIAVLLSSLLFIYLFLWRPRKRLKKAFAVIFGKEDSAPATPNPPAATTTTAAPPTQSVPPTPSGLPDDAGQPPSDNNEPEGSHFR